ncbi:MAG: hypothetical protein ACO3JL_16080 [Myxococcota bacterium]
MMPRFELEAVLLAGLCAMASFLVHVLLYVVVVGPAPTEPGRLVVELRTATPAAVAPSSDAAEAPQRVAPGAPKHEGHEGAADSPRDRRALLRAREAAFARDMQTRADRLAALHRHDGNRGGAAAPLADIAPQLTRCDRESEDVIRAEGARSMAVYADLTPVGLFPPRYLERVWQVQRATPRRLGTIEMALPPEELVVQLDEPRDAIFVVGRRDRRCLVGFSWSKAIFPLTFRGIPVRFVGADDVVIETAIDVSLHADATFEIMRAQGQPLPFARGALYDQRTVARNLQQRAMGARVVRDLFGALLGGAP